MIAIDSYLRYSRTDDVNNASASGMKLSPTGIASRGQGSNT